VSGALGECIWSLPCRPTLWRLLVFSLDLIDEKTLKVFIRLIDLLHFNKHRRLYIRQANDDGLHFTASSRSNFSAIASLQNAEIFRHLLLFSRSSAWWSCWAVPCGMVLHQQVPMIPEETTSTNLEHVAQGSESRSSRTFGRNSRGKQYRQGT